MSHADLIKIYISEKTASSMGGPVETAALRTEAERAVSEAIGKIDAIMKEIAS